MIPQPRPKRRRPRWLALALASTILTSGGGAALALPSTPTIAGANGPNPTFSFGPTSLTVTQNSSRAVINWASFNIAAGESVNFTQPSTSAIAFNIVPAGVPTTISGSLTANGGVWLFSPAGVLFGAGSVVSTGSLLVSTGVFNATSLSEALNTDMIEIFPQATVGAGSITVAPTASLTANAGFLALQSPTIDQEGSLTATDAVVLNALEGMQVTVAPGSGGVTLQSEVPTAPAGGSSHITSSGAINAAWVELDAFNNNTANPGVSGIINLSGHVSATGLKPGGNHSIDLVADYGSVSPSDLVTTLDAHAATLTAFGAVNATAGTLSLGSVTAATGGVGPVNLVAGDGGLTTMGAITTGAYDAVSLTSSGAITAGSTITGLGDVDLTATHALSVAGSITAGGGVNLLGDTIVVGPGVTVSGQGSVLLHAPDGVAADATSLLTSGVVSSPGSGYVEVQTGSTAGPADLVVGEVNAGDVYLNSDAGFTQPAGGVATGFGDIVMLGDVTTGIANSVNIYAARNVTIDGAVNVQGSTSVYLSTGAVTAGGDYAFGPNGSLSFTGTPGGGQSLNINGWDYTLVYSEADLVGVNNDLGGHYALANSLDMANLYNPANPSTPQAVLFTASPIANTSSPEGGVFSGVFAGLGHTIANLSIDQTVTGPGYVSNGEVGLFGYVGYGGVVRDINLANAQVTAGDLMDAGALVGYLNGTVQNASASGTVTGGLGYGPNGWGVGGLVGAENNGGLIVNSHASVQVTGGGSAWAGGLVGALTNGGTIQSSYATGSVTIGDSVFFDGAAGGLVGGTYEYPYPALASVNAISGSYATGAVTGGAGTQVGGLIGDVVQTTITTSYATGAVSQSAAFSPFQDQAGGFAGFIGGGGVVTQSYASGSVTSTGATGQVNQVGGFVGALVDNGSISDSYALGAVASSNDSQVGGFAGALFANLGGPGTPSISGVYATGAVSDPGGTSAPGGLAGSLTAGSFSDSFWDTSTTGRATAIGVNTVGPQTNLIAVNSTDAYAAATYSGVFDLTGTWVVFDGLTRPILRSEYSTTISSAHQLQLMALDLGAHYTLAADIDASETTSASGVWNPAKGFAPVGASVAAAFTGSFDGQGHTISNLSVFGTPTGSVQSWSGQSSYGAAGLFGVEGASGVIGHVSLANVDVTGGAGMDVGALVGLAQGQVVDASSAGVVSVGGPSSGVPAAAGGLVGGATGTITHSSSSATVSGGAADVGGLVGWLAPGGAIADSLATGAVTAGDGAGGTLDAAAGGLVGMVGTPFGAASSLASVTTSHATGAVTAGADASAGGLIGVLDGGQASQSYASGGVSAGLLGGGAVTIGGFAGDIASGQVSGAYATGAVTTTDATSGAAGDAIGGFAGQVGSAGALTTSYSSGAVNAKPGGSAALATDAGGFVGQIAAGGAATTSYTLSDVTISGAPAGNQSSAGGFAGLVAGGVSNVYASGAVADDGLVGGGLIGTLAVGGTATTGFWDGGVSPETNAVGVNLGTASGLAEVGGTGPSAYQAASYAGFDFTNVWYLVAGETRPILRAEYSTTITNAHQLQLMALDLGASYVLANNIDASETTSIKGIWNPANGFVPVGATVSTPFAGGFDGQGHTISNLTVIDTGGVYGTLPSGTLTLGAAGLFGFAAADITGVHLANANVTGGDGMSAGALVGNLLSGSVTQSSSSGVVSTGANQYLAYQTEEATAGGLVGTASGQVAYSTSSADVSGGEAQVGGLVGQLQGGSVLDSYATGTVTVAGYGGLETPAAGGLVGVAENGPSSASSITGSFATGNVTAGAGTTAGGLLGSGSQVVITTSYATGDVTLSGPGTYSSSDSVGGFAGLLTDSQVSRSFSSGAVTVTNPYETSWVGGFAGQIVGGSVSDAYAQSPVTANNSSYVGGFVGQADSTDISRVLATGAVGGSGFVGGLAGLITNGSVSDSYWDEGATGQITGYNIGFGGSANGVNGIGGGTGLDPYSASTYDWDFENTWSTPSAGMYPALYGVSHVVRMRAEDTSTVYADYPIYTVDEYGFQPQEGPSLVTGLSGGATGLAFSGSSHYQVTTLSGPYAIAFAGASASSPNGSGDYAFIYENGALTVTPRAITADLTNVVKTYDATTNAVLTPSNYVLYGAVGGDDVQVDAPPTSGTYDQVNVGTGIGVTVNGAIALTGADAIDYTVNSAISHTLVGEIDPALLEITAVTDSKIYDGTQTSSGTPLVVSGLQGSDTVTNLAQMFDSRNAGSPNLVVSNYTVNDGNGGNNYTVTLDSVAGTITPAALELSAVTDSKIYDGTMTSAGAAFIVGGLVSGDTVTGLAQAFDSKNAGARTLNVSAYTINDGNGGANYTVTLDSASGTITPAALTLAAVTDSKVYDANALSGAAPDVTGLVSGDSITGLSQSFDSKNAGARTLAIDAGYAINDGAGGANYTVTLDTASGTITPAALTLSAVTDSKIYDGNVSSTGAAYVVGGLQGSDTVTGLAQVFDSRNAGPRSLDVSAYTINDGAGGANYTVTLDSASGTITPAALTLAAVTDSKIYNANVLSNAAPDVTGLVSGDTITGLSQSFDIKNVGTRTLSIDAGYVISDGAGGNNYTVTLDTASGSITPAALTLTAVTDTRTYNGGVASSVGPDVIGLQGSDTVSGLAQSFDSKNAGSRTLTIDAGYVINDDNGGNNYTLTLDTASGTITPAALILSAVTDSKIYDANALSGGAPIIVSGLVGGDSVTGLSQSFDSKNAGARTLAIDAGYAISDGNGGANYTVTLDTASGTITPAALTLSAVTDSKIYDGNVSSTGAAYVVGGLQGSDTVTGLAQAFDSRNAGPRSLDVSAYTINDGAGGANYTVTLDSASGTITPAALTLAAVTDSKTYNANVLSSAAPDVTGLVTGDSIGGLAQVFDSKNAGSRTLSIGAGYVISDGNGGNNYTVTLDTASGSITPAALTLTAVTDTRTYNGGVASSVGPKAIGLQGSDTVSGLAQTFDSRNAGARTLAIDTGYVINDGNGGANYILTIDTASGRITPAALTLSAVTDSKIYDANALSGGAPIIVSGLVGGDSVSGLTQSFDSKNAGARTLAINAGYAISDGNGGANYTVTLDTASGTITPAALTLSAVTDSKIYDGTISSTGAAYVVGGLQGSDTVTGLAQAFDSRNAGARTLDVSAYTINDGNSGANYTVTLDRAAGTITPAALTLAAVSDSKVYDANVLSGAAPEVTGLVSGDSISGLAQTFDSKNAGARTLDVSAYTINDGAGGNNYTVTLDTASGSITPAALTLTAVTDTRTYNGGVASSVGPDVIGLQGSDTVSGLAQSFDSKNAGARTLAIDAGYVINDGNGGNNYTLTLDTASGTITPAALTLSAVTDSKVYDGTVASGSAPVVVSGLVSGDSVSGLSQSFDSRNAGARTLSIDAGYAISDGNGGNNYTVTLDTASGTITPAALTLAAVSDSRTYDGTVVSSAAPDVTGLVGGDSITGLSQSFDSRNAGSRTLSIGAGYVIDDGNGGANYKVTVDSASGTITPAALTLTAVTDTKVYDTTTVSTAAPDAIGLVGGDTVTGLSQAFDSKNAGARTLSLNADYAINDGAGGANYTVTVDTAAGAITPAPLTVNLTGTVFKVYDGNTLATLTPSNYRVSGVYAGDTVTLNEPTKGLYDTPKEGVGKLVSVTGLGLTGADAGNYSVSATVAGPVGEICLTDCILPPVFTEILTNPEQTKVGQLQFQFAGGFDLDLNLPVAPESDKRRKGDLFPVTGAGNRDLWTRQHEAGGGAGAVTP